MIYSAPTLALYCLRCGRLQTHDLYSFGMKNKILTCNCGEKQAIITATKHHQYLLSIPCTICETNHIICLDGKLSDWQEPVKLYCPTENVEIGFIGVKDAVERLINQQKCECEEICDLDDSVEDPLLMIEVINRIHDLAENGGLYCHCGSSLIRAEVCGNGIELYCLECGGHIFVGAQTEQDLRFINSCKDLELIPNPFKYTKPGS